MFGKFSILFHRQAHEEFDRLIKEGRRTFTVEDPTHNPADWTTILFKEYPRMPRIKLPKPNPPNQNIYSILQKRHSASTFDHTPISQETLSTLLYYTAGINKTIKKQGGNETDWDNMRRFYPSGGAMYPLEVYLGIDRVSGLEKGIYHYNVKEHCLEQLLGSSGILKLHKNALIQPQEASVFYFITSVWDRNFTKYQNFGYKIILLEAGHMAQNAQLVATSLRLASKPSVGFYKKKIDKLIDLDDEVESTLYMIALGSQK
tara:strand:- start:1861 stop:2640 length:780 start_codon:yes stop_codon:yes gene_type:complete